MKTSIALIFCLMIITLSACGNKSDQPNGFEPDSGISGPVESSTQEPDNGISEPVESSTQEADAALSRANTVESQIEQIKNGDFSNVTGLSWDAESFERICNSEAYEWVECDLNGNGLRGLLRQKKDSSPLEIKRIDAIIAVTDNEARVVDATFGRQMTEIFFLSKNGNIIYRYGYGGPASYDYYAHYVYTDDWSRELVVDLTVIAYDWETVQRKNRENGVYDEEVEKQPPWALAGVCYYTKGGDDPLDEPQFLKAYEEMTGYSFYDDNPMKPDWVK